MAAFARGALLTPVQPAPQHRSAPGTAKSCFLPSWLPACLGLFHPTCRTLPVLNSVRFLSDFERLSLLTSRQTISGILSLFTVSHITEDNQIGQIDLLFLNLCWMDMASGKKTCLYNCPGDPGKRLVSAFVCLCMSNLFNLFLAQSYLGQCFPSTVFCYWAQTSSEENDGKKVMST